MISRIAAAALAAVSCVAFAGTATAASLNNYAAYLDGPAHASYVPSATTFTVANASGAHSIWTWTPSGTLNASPAVYAGEW
jgi:hypothetical protein